MHALARVHPAARLLRVYWTAGDWLLWQWWVMGGREMGVGRFRWYRGLEVRWQRGYDAVYWPMLRWIAKEIGE